MFWGHKDCFGPLRHRWFKGNERKTVFYRMTPCPGFLITFYFFVSLQKGGFYFICARNLSKTSGAWPTSRTMCCTVTMIMKHHNCKLKNGPLIFLEAIWKCMPMGPLCRGRSYHVFGSGSDFSRGAVMSWNHPPIRVKGQARSDCII